MRQPFQSALARGLQAGRFVVTAEIAPPHGVDLASSLAMADRLAGLVDAINVTDNQNARLRLSPLAFSHQLLERGHDVVYQITCRDRNRLAIQSDLLGAWALGVRNVLALTGDHISAGDHPDAAPVFDLDSVQLLRAITALNEGQDMAGKLLRGGPMFFPGAALACAQKPTSMALMRFRKKVEAGARFFQTQAVFDPACLAPFAEEAAGSGVFILAGILLLHSRRMIEHINDRVPGLKVPPATARRVGGASNPVKAGMREAARLILACRPFCHGVHLMTAGRDDLLPELLEMAGLAPGA